MSPVVEVYCVLVWRESVAGVRFLVDNKKYYDVVTENLGPLTSLDFRDFPLDDLELRRGSLVTYDEVTRGYRVQDASNNPQFCQLAYMAIKNRNVKRGVDVQLGFTGQFTISKFIFKLDIVKKRIFGKPLITVHADSNEIERATLEEAIQKIKQEAAKDFKVSVNDVIVKAWKKV